MLRTLEQPWTSYVNGRWAEAGSGKRLEIADPGRTDFPASVYDLAPAAAADEAVAAAAGAFPGWSETPAAARAAFVYDLIDVWRGRIDDLAEIVTREMGKPLRESRSEATRAVEEMRFWAGEALRLGDRTFDSTRRNTEAMTIRQPLGPVAAIAPWNFPILAPVRKVIPALICGCTVVLKPALQAPGASVLFVRMLEEVGVPAGTVNLLIGSGREVGERLIQSGDIAGITFTGSTDVGLHIASVAAPRNARLQLEMGGKNAAVVANYADVEHAAAEISAAAFAVAGQRCTAVSRVIVLESEKEALEAALVRRAEAIKVGYGADEGIEMGPVVSEAQLRRVESYVRLAEEGQGRVLTGGRRPRRDGNYYAPTIVTDVRPGSPLFTDEIFGPVLVVTTAGDFDEAVRLANDTRYGLTSAIFTDDMNQAYAFAMRSQAGMVHVNHGTTSEGHVPFGGWKQSGRGAFGIGDTSAEFYTTLKAVYRMHRR
ncbi:aldehyde dehydrogenase family protein [Salinarimonas rosea]|uniref:aldehyde dehydrogenase family protein n=1 Tax=Salinarimonas rosea TaxID=552063 RepID=UPI0003F5332B|nr:aldehyde dehydrogenase family protein [Salinarimonas rosea]